MLLHVPQVLSSPALERCREVVAGGTWLDGRVTAGTQSEKAKNNLQLDESSDAAREGRRIVQDGLSRSALFFTAALPRRVFPPLFNRYGGGANAFGDHIDNAVRMVAGSGEQVRTDLSATLFLSPPQDYDGGELVIQSPFGEQRVKLPAGGHANPMTYLGKDKQQYVLIAAGGNRGFRTGSSDSIVAYRLKR